MGEKYNDTAHALENMRRSPYTVTRAPRGPATQGEASEADLSGNQPIATHEASLKLTANAEPEHPRQSLWRESVRAFLRCLRARLLRSRGSKTMKKAPSRPCLHPLLLKKRPLKKAHHLGYTHRVLYYQSPLDTLYPRSVFSCFCFHTFR